MTAGDQILNVATWFALIALPLAFVMTVVRVILGPSLPDRVVALDMLVAIAIGFIAVIALKTGFHLYIDIAMALGSSASWPRSPLRASCWRRRAR